MLCVAFLTPLTVSRRPLSRKKNDFSLPWPKRTMVPNINKARTALAQSPLECVHTMIRVLPYEGWTASTQSLERVNALVRTRQCNSVDASTQGYERVHATRWTRSRKGMNAPVRLSELVNATASTPPYNRVDGAMQRYDRARPTIRTRSYRCTSRHPSLYEGGIAVLGARTCCSGHPFVQRCACVPSVVRRHSYRCHLHACAR